MLYKILTADQWQQLLQHGQLDGSADDRRDGYIHLSAAAQVLGTLQRHFTGAAGLLLAGFDPAALGPALRWEASRGGRLFPHLYAALPLAAVRSVEGLAAGAAQVCDGSARRS